jgi:integrase
MNSHFNFTKKTLSKLPVPEGRAVYHDTDVKGLSLRIYNSGTISFFVRGSANGERVINPLGKYPNVTIEQARVKAREALNIMAAGTNPKHKAKVDDAYNITLEQLLKSYIKSRGTNLQDNTIKNYQSIFDNYLNDWKNKKLLDIKQDMVEEKHRNITKKSPTRANTSMRLLRALFNYAKGEYQDSDGMPIFNYNPTHRLSHIKAWNREKRKQTFIKTYDLKKWYESVMELPKHQYKDIYIESSEVCRDLFLFILFTGLRKSEASELMWSNIDFKDKSLMIEDTKNHESHSLPLTPILLEILERRMSNSIYVFQGSAPDFKELTLNSSIDNIKNQVNKVRAISGIYFSIHDLRRTFITIAESLDINSYALKRLLNHKDKRDVTSGYIVPTTDRLREPMQRITDYILEQIK